MDRFAAFVIRLRWPIFLLILAITAFFAWEARHVRFRTTISDLWPAAHPFIKVHRAYEDQYGSPLSIYVMVQVKKGDIYNPVTLEKIARITREIDSIRGVNHDQVVSITSRKVKSITLSGAEVHVENLYPRETPRTEEALAKLRDDVAGAGVIGTLVSFDGTASLISGNFLEARTDLQELFEKLLAIEAQETDEAHNIYLAGQPVLLGWVHTYQREIVNIVLLSITLTFLLLYLYIRSIRLTVLPALATIVSTIWGLGFAGLLRYTLDPLILLIPALLMARTLSHGIQKVERIIELSGRQLDKQAEARTLILALFGSGTLGITTDVIGLLVIAISSIPVMQRLAFFCGFWAASIIPSVLIFIPVVISIFGIPASWQVMKRLEESALARVLKTNAWLVTGWRARWIIGAFAVATVVSFIISLRISVGDIHPGTALLWPDAPYNVAAKNINKNFVGTDELYVIARVRDGEGGADGSAAGAADRGSAGSEVAALLGIRRVPILSRMLDFQRYVERNPLVRHTFSYADFFPVINRRMHGNGVKWECLPDTEESVAQFSNVLLRGTDPGDFRRFVDDRYQHANIILWLNDHRGRTLDGVLRWIRSYPHLDDGNSGIELQFASGFAGVLAAVDEEVEEKELLMFILATLIVGIACLVSFRSLLAATILIVPLVVTNFVVMSVMVFMEIALDVNTLPIVSVGMGVGIDYGIYLLTRILQEYRRNPNYDEANAIAIQTTGRAVFFTATIMIVCVGVWYFLSSFRFMAEMGSLLALVMGINMLGALLVVPAIISVMKPRFALSARLLVWD